jgi:PAS domain S-box-containing protein
MSLKLIHKAFLLVIIPLLLALGFIFLLLVNVEQIERNAEAEARSGEALVYVNLCLYDGINAGCALITFKQFGEERYHNDFRKQVVMLAEHREQLREFAKMVPEEEKDITTFINCIDDFTDVFSQAVDVMTGENITALRLVGKVRSYMQRVNVSGTAIIEKEVTARKYFREQSLAASRRLRILMEIFGAAVLIIAIGLGWALSTGFNKRLKVLVENTKAIALDRPLESRLSGNDELALFDTVIHDLSSQLVQTRAKERAMIDNTAEIICSMDERLRITQVNPAIRKILGTTDSDILGTSLPSILHEDDRRPSVEALERCKNTGRDVSFEARMRKSDGQFIDSLWTINWSQDELSFFCVVHDISARKDAERLKQQVLAMVSHDLRSPLTSLGMTLELLLDGVFGTLNEQGTGAILNAEQTVKTLIAMISDLLDAEKFELGGFTLDTKKTNVHDLVNQAIDMVQSEAEKKRITVRNECEDLFVKVDSDSIRRVMMNLLANATKFSPPSSFVSVATKKMESTNSVRMVELQVIDSGPGIPEDKLSTIFEKFKQVGTGSEGERVGSGLGLAICKAIVEAHGGKIGVTSHHKRGSTFWIQLPSA